MKISVIIPNYNRANLIGETLDNVLSQSLSPHEVIVVDDGSTDNSLEVLKRYSSKIKLISQPNKGPGAARNAGFRIATGEFIQFFDSDDVMTSNKFEVQAGILQANNDVDFVYGPYVMAEKSEQGWMPVDVIMQYVALPNTQLHHLVAEGWCAITQSCLFRRELVERAGAWREDLMPHEDKEYWYRLGREARSHQHESKSCVFYRQHQQQITDGHVKVLARTLDGVKAYDHIIRQMEHDQVDLFSKLLSRGVRAGYVKYLNAHNQFDVKNSTGDTLCYLLYRVKQKLGRIKTGTNWQPFHGSYDNREKFYEYLKMLNN